MIAPVSPNPSAPAAEPIKKAGADFEAMLLQQMLRAIVPEAEALGGLATEAFARALADASPFGVARLLESAR